MDYVAKPFDTRSFVLERNHIKVVYITSLLFIRATLPNWRDIYLEKNCTNVEIVARFNLYSKCTQHFKAPFFKHSILIWHIRIHTIKKHEKGNCRKSYRWTSSLIIFQGMNSGVDFYIHKQ